MYKYRNRILLGGVIALAIYIGLLLLLDNEGQLTAGVLDALQGYPWLLLVPLALCQVAAGFFRFLEWHYYLGVIDARDKISLADSAIIFVAGFTMVVSPGKAAELLKSVFLKIKTSVPIARSAPIVVAERVVDGLAVIVILTITLLVAADQLDLGEFDTLSRTIVFSSAAFIGFALVAVQIQPLGYFVLRVIGMIPLLRRTQEWFTALYESAREIFQLRHVIPTTTMGLGVYMSSTLGFMVILYGFGLEMSGTLLLQVTFIVGVSSAVGALSFVPNGAGVTEVSNAAMLMAIVAPDHPEMTVGMAAATALLQGFFHKWFRVVVGLLVALIFRERLFTPGLAAEIAAAEQVKKHTNYAGEAVG